MMTDIFLLFLLGFVCMLLLTALHTLWTGVPLVPTSKQMAKAMMQLHTWRGDETVLDLGAGDGRLLEFIKESYPGVRARGCEIVPAVWLIGYLRAFYKRSGVHLRLGSMFLEDVSDADVVCLYLFPEHMQRLAEKFTRELPPGTVVITHTFGFSGRRPEKIIRQKSWGGQVDVYAYRW